MIFCFMGSDQSIYNRNKGHITVLVVISMPWKKAVTQPEKITTHPHMITLFITYHFCHTWKTK